MSSGLVLVVVVVGAYLAAHVAFEWLTHRFKIVSGAEYLLLGALLGPELAGLISPGAVDGFSPFMTLALGWIGALVGAQFHVPQLLAIPGSLYRVAFLEACIGLALITGCTLAVLTWWFAVPVAVALVPAVALGTIGTVSAPSAIALVGRMTGAGTPAIRQMQVATAVDALVAITTFGALAALAHPGLPPSDVRSPTATEWGALSLAIGLGGGVLFHLFLGRERKIDRLFIAVAGALILTSGAAAYISLSPLLPSMLVGMVLVNTSSSRDEIRELLSMVERPLYFVLLIFAGAAWEPLSSWLLPVLGFLVARIIAKVASAWLAERASAAVPAYGPTWGLGLLGHGGLAVALGLSYTVYGDGPLSEVVFTATLVSVVLTDVLSVRLVQIVVSRYESRVLRMRAGADSRTGAEAP